jgi:hypothetical protein
MALVDGGVTAEAVEIPATVNIPDIDAGAPGEDHGYGVVVVSAIFLFQFQILERQIRVGGQYMHKKRRYR